MRAAGLTQCEFHSGAGMMTSQDEDCQTAFTTLLRNPVIDRSAHSNVWAIIRRPGQQKILREWFSYRLGYRLIVTKDSVRLHRTPNRAIVTAPRRIALSSRRELVLALLSAVAAESAADRFSTQELSDQVRLLSQQGDVGVTPYDPDQHAERKIFARGLVHLVQAGALRPLTSELDADSWATRSSGVGQAFEIRRESLLRLVAQPNLLAATGQIPAVEQDCGAVHRHAVLRRILELPVCYYADLSEGERAYLTQQRHRVVAWCVEMTGWSVEQRREGFALIAETELDTDLPLPGKKAAHYVTTLVLDQLLQEHGCEEKFSGADLLAAVSEVRARHPKAMTKSLDGDQQVADFAHESLCALDLLRIDPASGDFQLTPAAHRYCGPKITFSAARLESLAL